MPVAFMEKFGVETGSFSGSESQSPRSWSADQPGESVCQRRQRNRDAARRSRKKQTEKADELHEELQALEQSNANYVKEIAELKKEIQQYTILLKEHEPRCTLQCWPGPSVTTTASTLDTSTSVMTQIMDSNCTSEFPFLPSPTQEPAPSISLADLLDSNDWYPLDSVNL